MTPEEAKIWIETEGNKAIIDRYVVNEVNITPALKDSWKLGATSLYQHLQENGRVAELEKEVERLNKIIEIKESERREWAGMYIKKKQECDELKEEMKNL